MIEEKLTEDGMEQSMRGEVCAFLVSHSLFLLQSLFSLEQFLLFLLPLSLLILNLFYPLLGKLLINNE